MKAAAFLFVALAVGLRAANPFAFEVEGRMDTFVPSWDNGAPNSRTFRFATDGRDLLIHTTAGTKDQGTLYAEFGTAGTNGFQFNQMIPRTNADGSFRGTLVNDSTMRIQPHPRPEMGVGQQLWLIYGAHGELRKRTNSFVHLTTQVSFRERPFDSDLYGILRNHLRLRADWALDGQPPHLVTRFVDYRDGQLMSERYPDSLIPDEYTTGKTNLRLEILSWTNVAGLHLPVNAQVTTYEKDTNQLGKLVVHALHRVTVTNVIAGTSRRTFVPQLGRATSVTDYRFMRGPRQPASYLSTNRVLYHTAEEAGAAIERDRERKSRAP
jgi:hypothetical protein